jgi:hypothetical protein
MKNQSAVPAPSPALTPELTPKEKAKMDSLPNDLAERLIREGKAEAEVIGMAQAVLTALNTGDVASESPLHRKLREVMIAYREAKVE